MPNLLLQYIEEYNFLPTVISGLVLMLTIMVASILYVGLPSFLEGVISEVEKDEIRNSEINIKNKKKKKKGKKGNEIKN